MKVQKVGQQKKGERSKCQGIFKELLYGPRKSYLSLFLYKSSYSNTQSYHVLHFFN